MREIFYSLKNTYEGYLKEQERATKEAKLIRIGSRMSMKERQRSLVTPRFRLLSQVESTECCFCLLLLKKRNEMKEKEKLPILQVKRVESSRF